MLEHHVHLLPHGKRIIAIFVTLGICYECTYADPPFETKTIV